MGVTDLFPWLPGSPRLRDVGPTCGRESGFANAPSRAGISGTCPAHPQVRRRNASAQDDSTLGRLAVERTSLDVPAGCFS